jgi:glucose/arabinose dehydrogenase
MKIKKYFFIAAFILMAAAPAFAQITLVNAFPGLSFSSPVFLTHSGDGTNRIFVVQQTGRIIVFPNDSTITTSNVFLDVSPKIVSGGEQGLLGLAFHPNFSSNRYFYIYYTKTGTGDVVISRFTRSVADPNKADSTSELVLLTIPHSTYSNHNGGCLMFGQDGYLYAGVGDGGSGGDPDNNGQNTNVLLAKILRIDVNNPSGGNNYGIPPTNPYAGGGGRPEIFCIGMRNPWRFSQDPVTGIIYIGDVGQNIWEEVDIMTNGGNYGWRIMEGFHCYNPPNGCDTTGLKKPIKEYNHSGNGCSITGGYVYRGSRVPALIGNYIYGDYCSTNIWRLKYVNGTVTEDAVVIPTALPPNTFSSFGVDQNNELYFCCLSTPGAIYRFIIQPIGITGSSTILDGYALDQNFPNPFNPTTEIHYTIAKNEFVNLTIFNPLGEKIKVLVNENKPAGNYTVSWDAAALPSGVYFYVIKASDFSFSRKMVLVK